MANKSTQPPNTLVDRNEEIRREYYNLPRMGGGRPTSGKKRQGMTVAELAAKHGISRTRLYAIVGTRKGGDQMAGKKRFNATLPTASIEQEKLDALYTIAEKRKVSLAYIEREAIDEYLARRKSQTTTNASNN